MTHVITSLCIRDGGCVTVCPVECIVPGNPQSEWPLYYIDPETCIDCGACIPECPVGAIFPLAEVPSDFIAEGHEILVKAEGTPGYEEIFEGVDVDNNPVVLYATRTLKAGEEIDFTPDIKENARYFSEGPGYDSMYD
jgi:NAD-dependent dihydropyrimidine dehydrogenase PreA subunit